jgi:hypothetical protein
MFLILFNNYKYDFLSMLLLFIERTKKQSEKEIEISIAPTTPLVYFESKIREVF